MSASGDAASPKLLDSLQVLRGLRNAGFSELATSRAALEQLHDFLTGAYATLLQTGTPEEQREQQPLLHLQQQQQGILQASAADLTLISMIFQGLAVSIQLPNSSPNSAHDAQQRLLRDAAPGEHFRKFLLPWQVLSRLHQHIWLLQVSTTTLPASPLPGIVHGFVSMSRVPFLYLQQQTTRP